MFYISKVTPLFVIFGFLNLFLSFFYTSNFHIWSYIVIYGFIQNIIIGTLYQIGPNSQSRKLEYENLSFLVFLLSVISSFMILLGKVNLANFVIFLTVLLFSLHIITVLKNIKPLTVRFLSVGLFYMNVSGLTLLLTNFFDIPYQIPIHIFTIGSLVNMVIGVQITWIPMLTMKVLDLKLAEKLFYIYLVVSFLFILSFFTFNFNLIFTCGMLVGITVIFFLFILYKSVFKDKILYIPFVVRFFLTGWVYFLIGLVAILYILLNKKFEMVYIHTYLMVYGFGLMTIMGGTTHIIPRIIWNWKYVEKSKEGKDVPQINKMVDEKVLKYGLYIFIIIPILMILLKDLLILQLFLATVVLILIYGIFSKTIRFFFT
ncbi:MAG: hypothetical protein ABWJ98_02900 [Hydrogenothermaceae bacterium]